MIGTLKISVLGHPWTVVMHSAKEFEKFRKEPEDKDLGAFALPWKRTIHFYEDNFYPQVVTHEVVHAYHHYMAIDTVSKAAFSAEDREEFVCEFVALHIDAISKTSKQILRRFLK